MTDDKNPKSVEEEKPSAIPAFILAGAMGLYAVVAAAIGVKMAGKGNAPKGPASKP